MAITLHRVCSLFVMMVMSGIAALYGSAVPKECKEMQFQWYLLSKKARQNRLKRLAKEYKPKDFLPLCIRLVELDGAVPSGEAAEKFVYFASTALVGEPTTESEESLFQYTVVIQNMVDLFHKHLRTQTCPLISQRSGVQEAARTFADRYRKFLLPLPACLAAIKDPVQVSLSARKKALKRAPKYMDLIRQGNWYRPSSRARDVQSIVIPEILKKLFISEQDLLQC